MEEAEEEEEGWDSNDGNVSRDVNFGKREIGIDRNWRIRWRRKGAMEYS